MSLLLSSAERISGCCRREPSAPYVCGAASQVSRRVCTDSVEFCTGFHATVRIHHPGAAFFLNPQFSRLKHFHPKPAGAVQTSVHDASDCTVFVYLLYAFFHTSRLIAFQSCLLNGKKNCLCVCTALYCWHILHSGRLALLHEVRNTTL